MNKRTLIIIVAAIVLLIGGIIAYIMFSSAPSNNQKGTPSSDEPTVSVRTDQDTGEQISASPSGTSESEDSTSVTLLGIGAFYDNGMTREQILFVKNQLTAYSAQNLANKYESLTVRPQDFVKDGDTITSTLRLGETDNLVNLRFDTGTHSEVMQLFITDPKGTLGGNFTSPATQLYAE